MVTPEEMWADYCATHCPTGGAAGSFTVEAFGVPGSDLAQELAELIMAGRKRATAGLLADYEAADELLPQAGDHTVVLDAGGDGVCIIRVSEVQLRPFGEVDEEFAFDEGEGDRTLATWRRAHRDFFAGLGWEVDDATMMVLVRFELVWPPDS